MVIVMRWSHAVPVRLRIALGMASIALLITGCGISINIAERVPADDVAPLPAPHAGPRPRGVIESIVIKRNLTAREADAQLTQEFLEGVRQVNLFSEVSTSRESRNSMRDVGMLLSVSETLDTHRDENQMRQERIERSYLLPVITPFYILYHKFESEFESNMTLEVDRWDGETRRYTARARGRMQYPYNADPEPSQQELIRQVTATVLQALSGQMARDRTFFVPPPGGNEVKAQ